MLLCRISASLIIGICLHTGSTGEIFFNQFFHPRTWNGIRAVGLSGMQFDSCLSYNVSAPVLSSYGM